MTTRALILRYADYKERSRILTVLTEQGEKLTVTSNGSKAYAEPYVCSELTLRQSNGRWYAQEGRTVAEFRGIRKDIEKFELAAYIAKIAEALSDSDVPQPELFRLIARAFDTMSKLEISADGTTLKRFQKALEIRIARIAGFVSFDEIREIL
ncbi:MAG: DNA repair protein RecO [Oscillospiraceae bacterium]|nr:DNA repair protein RecO [Oscillospiraceae bacterium]